MGTGFVGLIAAMSFLVAGITYGRFSGSKASTPSTFATGTVSYNAPASTLCNVGTGAGQTAAALRPADASSGWSTPAGSDAPCTLAVTYNGTANGYLGLDVLIATKAGTVQPGAPSGTLAAPLYDGSANGLQLQITDTKNGSSIYYVNGTKYTTQGSTPSQVAIGSASCPVPYTSGYSCYQVTDLLVSTTAFASSQSDTFSINYQLPTTSTAGYENSTATVVLTVHAVQSGNNAVPTSPASTKCFAVAQCSAGFAWS